MIISLNLTDLVTFAKVGLSHEDHHCTMMQQCEYRIFQYIYPGTVWCLYAHRFGVLSVMSCGDHLAARPRVICVFMRNYHKRTSGIASIAYGACRTHVVSESVHRPRCRTRFEVNSVVLRVLYLEMTMNARHKVHLIVYIPVLSLTQHFSYPNRGK
jgi:hypothetical protein